MRAGAITRKPLATLAVLAMLGGLLITIPAQPADAAVTVVAYDMVDTTSLNLTDHTNPWAGAFPSSPGDGFEKYQRGVSSSIPFGVLDDSLIIFPTDSQGIIKDNFPDPDHEFFGVVDTQNDDNSGEVSATWTFDIGGAAEPLNLSIDMGAMGDFESGDPGAEPPVIGDFFRWEFSIDGSGPSVAFESTIVEDAAHTYVLQGGTPFLLQDPAFVGTTLLTNDLQTLTTGLTGTGNQLVLTLTAQSDGGSEAFAFQNIVITSGEPDPVPILINEVDSDTPGSDVLEFIELYDGGVGNTPLDGLSVVLWNGSDDQSYTPAFDLDGFTTDGDGYFVIGTVPGADIDVSPGGFGWLQNGADAVLLLEGDAADYPVDTALPLTDVLVDAIVYDTSDGDDTVLLAAFTPGHPQVNEDGNGNKDNESNQRCPNGAGAAFETEVFKQWAPTPGMANLCEIPEPTEQCGDPATLIHDIQGNGATSPLEGETHSIEGVVIGDFQGADGLNGVFVQEEEADGDGDDATSEGIFVLDAGAGDDVAVGDVVRATGTVSEGNQLTQLNPVTALLHCDEFIGTASETSITLPVAAVGDWEQTEGMLVTIDQLLYASGNFSQGRFGEVDLSINGPLDNPTNVVTPGAASNALQDLNDRSRIQLDDGSNEQNPLPLPPYLGPGNTLRTGDTVNGVTGALGDRFGTYEVHPTETVAFSRVNARPLTPPDVGGDVTVAAFNVLNYFTTIDVGTDICGPAADQGCRGADTADEFDRQRAKIINAIGRMGADVVGLMEIENHPGDVPAADLVGGLNDAGFGPYDFIATGAVGIDAIRQAIIYQPDTVAPVGGFAILDAAVDPTFNDDKNRPVVAQTFMDNASGEMFTVAVNHLKSKGSACDDVGDPNAGDGQGNCNGIRTAAASAMAAWLAGDPTGSGDPDVLIIGDLNAYAYEDPVTVLESAGYTDLIEVFVGEGFGDGAYSFNFFSQSGYLDHGLASPSILPQVTGAAFWHINADEPSGLDYNNFNQPALYNPDPWRSSDHDPVLIGLATAAATPAGLKQMVLDDLSALVPSGNSRDDRAINKAIGYVADSLNPAYWADDSYLTEDGRLVFNAERKAVTQLGLVSGSAADAAQAAIDTLVGADMALAQGAIDIAVATGGSQGRINKALAEMDKAAAALAGGQASTAVYHYRNAWFQATKAVGNVRFATFNASLNRFNAGDLVTELSTPGSSQPDAVAEIIQRARPEVLLVNEFDYDAGGASARLFQDNYLSVAHGDAAPIEYPFRYVAPSNTGVPSGFDLDNVGGVGGPGDAFGFGFFPGQFGMVVYSMFPIDVDEVRTFQNFLWKDMPGALLPEDPPGTPWYSEEELEVFRLSSKSHWDLPLITGDERVHFLTSHPTPPVFDGPEDRNGTRNFDEIRFWADYVDGASYIYDDNNEFGGLGDGAKFVIAGDQNSDPLDGDSIPGAIQQLLDNPRVNDTNTPSSLGGSEQAALQGGANDSHLSDPAFDTADFSDFAPGNLRADYVLPSADMEITASAVFWPTTDDPLFPLVGTFPFPSSDHRLVWIDANV